MNLGRRLDRERARRCFRCEERPLLPRLLLLIVLLLLLDCCEALWMAEAEVDDSKEADARRGDRRSIISR